MNDYASLRKKNNGRLPAALVLTICVVLSGSMLFSRLMAYAPADTRHYIPLTQGNGLTHVTATPLDPQAAAPQSIAIHPMPSNTFFILFFIVNSFS